MATAAAKPQTEYRVVGQADKTFAVEVTPPGASPTLVMRFANAGNAEIWIDGRKRRDLPPPVVKPVRKKKVEASS